MAYYIKIIGSRGKPASIFDGKFAKVLLYQMRFKTPRGKTQRLKKGDKLVLYCAGGSAKEFPRGGFIGTQEVLAAVRREIELFDEPWSYIVDVHPESLALRNVLTIKEVKKWQEKSGKLETALKAELQAIGGLWEIEKSDYLKFVKTFTLR